MLFVLGACSTAGEGGGTGGGGDVTVPGETGDPVIDAAMKDALTQVGSVEGMDVWSVSFTFSAVEGIETKMIRNLYLSADKHIETEVHVMDGTGDMGMGMGTVTVDNEVVVKIALEGKLTTSTDFKLFDSTGAEITDKKGYTTFYAKPLTTAMNNNASINLGGDGKWVVYDMIFDAISDYIVKKTDTELSMIAVSRKRDNDNNVIPNEYNTISGTMDEEIADAYNYTK